MKTCYSIPVLFLIVLYMMQYQKRVKDRRVQFIEFSEKDSYCFLTR